MSGVSSANCAEVVITDMNNVVAHSFSFGKGAKLVVAVINFWDVVIAAVDACWKKFKEAFSAVAALIDISTLVGHISRFIHNKFASVAERIYIIFFSIFRALGLLSFVEKCGIAPTLTQWGTIFGSVPVFGLAFNLVGIGVGAAGSTNTIMNLSSMAERAAVNDKMYETISDSMNDFMFEKADGDAYYYVKDRIKSYEHKWSIKRLEVSDNNITLRRVESALNLLDTALKTAISVFAILGFFGIALGGVSLALTGPLILSLALATAVVGFTIAFLSLKYPKKGGEYQEAQSTKDYREQNKGKAEFYDKTLAKVEELLLKRYQGLYQILGSCTGRPMVTSQHSDPDQLEGVSTV